MNQNFLKPRIQIKEIVFLLIITIVVVIGTFPANDWSFSVGIDPPLMWVFNTFFENGLNAGQHILFPHGPLAFFMYPLSENILLATLVTALLKALLALNTYGLLYKSEHWIKWPIILIFTYGVSIISGFNQLLLVNVIMLYCNYFHYNLKYIKLAAFFITALAFYVKAYVAILTGTMFVSVVIYSLITKKNLREFIFDAFAMSGFILLFWLFMYGSMNGFFHYVFGMLNLAQDNSAAAAVYPYNNWWLLAFAMIALAVLAVVNRSSKSVFFFLMIGLSLFAAWKHGMAREDFYHVRGLLNYIIISLAVFLLFEQKKHLINVPLVILIVVLFSLNLKNCMNYLPLKYEYFGTKNFAEFITDFNNLKARAHQKTAENLQQNRLPQNMLDTINGATADVYPWDYSIAAINNLNWKPRVVIQSYASYTSWLDQQNADYFSSDKSPEFIVWEKEKITKDINGGNFNSIDYRYLLNDEPQTLIQIMSKYEPCCANEKFLLLKKRNTPLSFHTEVIDSQQTNWNRWIDIPTSEMGLLRAKLSFKKSLQQSIKSFFYKDEQFWIYLKLENGSIHKYRIVPKNASDGLWISPYFFDFEKHHAVKQIMFKASRSEKLKQKLFIDWDLTAFSNSPTYPFSFFRIPYFQANNPVFESFNDFETPEVKNWSAVPQDHLNKAAYRGNHAYDLNKTEFSCTYNLSLDSIPMGKIRIETDAWVLSPDYNQSKSISLVIAIDDENGQIFYKAVNIDEQLIDQKNWNHIFNLAEINHTKEHCKMKVYFWTRENKQFIIDNFRVRIVSQKSQ